MDGFVGEVKVRILKRWVELVRYCNKWYLPNLVYADDATLFARRKLDLKIILDSFVEVCVLNVRKCE